MNSHPIGADQSTGESLLSLTDIQWLFWTGQQLDPHAPIYNSPFRIFIPTELDTNLFQQAFQEIVNRAESLRTTIQIREGLPFRHIVTHPVVSMPLIDVSTDPDPRKSVITWTNERTRRHLPLDQLMFDTAILKMASDEFVWYINQHHLICDAWGVTQLFRLQSEYYAHLKSGEPLPESNNLGWALELKRSPSDQIPKTANPTEFFGETPGKVQSSSTRIRADIADTTALGDILQAIARDRRTRSLSHEMTLFNISLTLLFSLLNRASGQSELTVGVPFHNRLKKKDKESIGPFISFHPIQVKVATDETFLSLLKKVQTASNQFLKNAASQKLSSQSYGNFNAVLNFIHAQFGTFDGVSVQPEWLHPGCHDRQHHMRLHVGNFSGTDKYSFDFDFNDDVFSSDNRLRVVGYFRKLASAMAHDLDSKIGSAAILSTSEEDQLLTLFNQSGEEIPQRPSVIDSFCKIVQTDADQIAIREKIGKQIREWTYQELNCLVDQMASDLNEFISNQASRIGICMPRSVEAVAAMLAILKTGHTFVPIGYHWPESRQNQVYEQGQIQWAFVFTEGQAPRRFEFKSVETQRNDVAVKDHVGSSDQLNREIAYILFTSGSTGKPKGVQISHESLSNYAHWAAEKYVAIEKHGQGKALSFPLFTPLTFDLTLTSIFVPLITGGTVIVYPQLDASADMSLLEVIEDNQVDIIKLTPSHLSLIADQPLPDSRVKQMILGGENLKSDQLHRLARIFGPELLIHNEYGPTEATVGCVVHTCQAGDPAQSISVPIGQPISGMKAFVLNDQLTPVPQGVVGELYLAGMGLANGYFQMAQRTSEAFLDQHNLGAIGRIYRTGDLARINSRNQLEYLGRIDQQVKIRGARIELGEIENALSAHPEIDAAVAITFGVNSDRITYCKNCGIASTYPGITYDQDGVCHQCRSFESYRERAQVYFKSMPELERVIAAVQQIPLGQTQNVTTSIEAPGTNHRTHDCIVLLSGGKDSTYMLARLADMGLKILAFTLDNGYISNEAKANIRRVVEALGVDHEFGSTPAMNEIFVDSLKRHANVCQGCFKTIYTLSLNLAKSRGIPLIFTGLSRGQFFETRLTEELFVNSTPDLVQIDETVLDARKAYHRVDDAAFRLLDVKDLQTDEIFEQVQFVDFYRYCDVDLDQMLSYLDKRLPWVRPSDTGRSTNCLINDVGIYVHQRRHGFHNYALPYSWDVRMGHKQRDQSLEELQDKIDEADVHRILREIGYDGDLGVSQATGLRLAAYYVSSTPIASETLSRFVGTRLPDYMVPSRFVHLSELPMTENGKIDTDALPDPIATQPVSEVRFVEPTNPIESKLAEIWSEILQVEQVGIQDNFFDLGGDSIMAIQIIAKAHRAGIRLTPTQFFEHLNIAGLASCSQSDSQNANGPSLDLEQTSLTPIQHWLFSHRPKSNEFWNQSFEIAFPDDVLDVSGGHKLQCCLAYLMNRHRSLRTRIGRNELELLPEFSPEDVRLQFIDLSGLDAASELEKCKQVESVCHQSVHIGSKRIAEWVLYYRTDGGPARLWVTLNHLATDAISNQLLVDELKWAWENVDELPAPLDSHPNSFAAWSNDLIQASDSTRFAEQRGYWQQQISALPPVLGKTDCQQHSLVTMADLRTGSASLSFDETQKYLRAIPKSRINLNELLIVALAKVVGQIRQTLPENSNAPFRFFVERHGRDALPESDHSQTIGWFTSLAPIAIDLPNCRPNEQAFDAELVAKLKDRLRAVPNQGIGYGLLHYLNSSEETRGSLSPAFGRELVFNFLGQSRVSTSDQNPEPFSVTRSLSLDRSPGWQPFAQNEVNVFVVNGQLKIEWNCFTKALSDQDIYHWASNYLVCFRQLAEYCIGAGASDASVSDFPLAQLDQDQLKNLSALLGQKKPGSDTGK